MENKKPKTLFSTCGRHVLAAVIAALFFSVTADAQTTLFRFETKLPNSVTPATGVFQMQFKLFDAAAGGMQIGSTNMVGTVDVQTRSFTVWLDFGAAAFPGADRYIEINYRRFGHEPFTPLDVRERILSVPYAIRSLTSGTADNALNLNGVPAGNFVQTTDPRLSDDRNPLPGSNNYIQNTNAQQSPADFNISGSGTANLFNAATQYDIGGNRILSNAGTRNVFAGVGAGNANTTGGLNAFFGSNAGLSNTTGNRNAYFGSDAGRNSTTGTGNSFFGPGAGRDNTTGFSNAFFGSSAGLGNTTGNNNAFFGSGSGDSNTTGASNSFFGTSSGNQNTTGGGNSFFGVGAGLNSSNGSSNSFVGGLAGFGNTAGGNNVFVGTNAAISNTTGSNNTVVGTNADVGNNDLDHATAIGAGAIVNTNNTVVLGRSTDKVHAPGNLLMGGGQLIAGNIIPSVAQSFSSGSVSGIYTNNLVLDQFGLNNVLASPIHLCIRSTNLGGGFGGQVLSRCSETEASPSHITDFKQQQTRVEALGNTIQTQREQIKSLQQQLYAIRQLVCQANPQAEVCK